MSLFRAILDAIMGQDELIAGMPFTRLSSVLTEAATTATVESTLDFGEWEDGVSDALLLIGGEIIYAAGRTAPLTFSALSRGFDNSNAAQHEPGSLVFDISKNTSALDHVRRGMLVDFAIGEDLDVVGRNLGLEKCVGLTEAQWRNVIRDFAYLPKTTTDAFEVALDILWGTGNYTIRENSISTPWKVFVDIVLAPATTLQGRFLLNGGEPALTTGANSVSVSYPVLSPVFAAYPGSPSQTLGARVHHYPAGASGTAIVGVYDDTPNARRGARDGMTNYFLPGGSVLGTAITLGTSPGAANTPVIVDYSAFPAHYLAENETTTHDADFYAYLADPLLTTRCLLEQVRAAGVRVEVQAGV